MGKWEGARGIGNVVPRGEILAKANTDVVIDTSPPAETLFTRPAGATKLFLDVVVGDVHIIPGDYIERTFDQADVNTTTNELTITGHGYTSGDGPYKLTGGVAATLVAGQFVNILVGPPTTLTRFSASWIAEGFADGMTIRLVAPSGLAGGSGFYTIDAGLTATVITLVAGESIASTSSSSYNLTGLGVLPAGLDRDTLYYVRAVDENTITLNLTFTEAVTGENPSGGSPSVNIVDTGDTVTNTIGGMLNSNNLGILPFETTTDGYNSVVLGVGRHVFSAPSKATVAAHFPLAGENLTYWWQ